MARQTEPEPVLSAREQWLLCCWMVQHPRAMLDDTVPDDPRRSGASRPRASGPRRTSIAYAMGLAMGTLWLWLVQRRWY